MRVRFTNFELDEIAHKMNIIASEPDLQDSYEITEAEAEAMFKRWLPRRAGVYTISKEEAEIIQGEIENSLEISKDNLETGDDNSRYDVVRFQKLLRKIKEQTP